MIESTRRHLLPWRVPRCRVLPARWRSGHQVTGCLPAYKCTGADVRIRHEQGLGCITLACEWKVSYMRSKSKGHTGCQCRPGGRVGILPYHRTSWYGFYSPAGCTCLTNHALGLLPECFSSRPTGGAQVRRIPPDGAARASTADQPWDWSSLASSGKPGPRFWTGRPASGNRARWVIWASRPVSVAPGTRQPPSKIWLLACFQRDTLGRAR